LGKLKGEIAGFELAVFRLSISAFRFYLSAFASFNVRFAGFQFSVFHITLRPGTRKRNTPSFTPQHILSAAIPKKNHAFCRNPLKIK
jgi:hypothetical protein